MCAQVKDNMPIGHGGAHVYTVTVGGSGPPLAVTLAWCEGGLGGGVRTVEGGGLIHHPAPAPRVQISFATLSAKGYRCWVVEVGWSS